MDDFCEYCSLGVAPLILRNSQPLHMNASIRWCCCSFCRTTWKRKTQFLVYLLVWVTRTWFTNKDTSIHTVKEMQNSLDWWNVRKCATPFSCLNLVIFYPKKTPSNMRALVLSENDLCIAIARQQKKWSDFYVFQCQRTILHKMFCSKPIQNERETFYYSKIFDDLRLIHELSIINCSIAINTSSSCYFKLRVHLIF